MKNPSPSLRSFHTNIQIAAIELPSVGSALSNNGLVLPVHLDGSVDIPAGVELDDASDEWFAALSAADAAIVNKFKEAR
jgi:hypothetical protein